MSGALGNIPGYTYDPIKKRYFFAPIAPTPSGSASPSSAAGRGRGQGQRSRQDGGIGKGSVQQKGGHRAVDKRDERKSGNKADRQQIARGKRRKVEEDERVDGDTQPIDQRRMNLYTAGRSNLDVLSRWRVVDQRVVQR